MRTRNSIKNEVLETIRVGKLIGIDFPEGYEHTLTKIISSEVTLPSTSKPKPKPKPKKANKSKVVPKAKQKSQVNEPIRNWLDLPSDITADILYRIGVFDILENAQKVCTTWRKICMEPTMWRVIKMDNPSDISRRPKHICQQMCKNAVDRSQGQLVDLSITDFCTDELLQYISDRSSKLRRLEVVYCFGDMYDCWGEYLKKLPLLEELSLDTTEISGDDIKSISRYCPMLKSLKVNQEMCYSNNEDNDEESITIRNELAKTIGENLHELRHLELINDTMTNIGLQAILNGCPHLESLDLRRCLNIDLNGDLGKRCFEQIKYLKLPHDSLDDLPHLYKNGDEVFDVCGDSDDDYHGNFEYEDYYEYDDNDDSTDIEDLIDGISLIRLNNLGSRKV